MGWNSNKAQLRTDFMSLLVARKRYLIDGIGVAAWLFWEFFHTRWKILFSHGGGTWDGCEMRIVMQGEKSLREVTFASGGDISVGGTWDGCKVRIKSHLMSTSHEKFGVVEGTLGHARWMQGEIWKVILCVPCMRTLLLDVTSLMSQGQMMKICKIFPLYTFQMSSRMDARWHLKSHLASTSCENFGVLDHARWTRGEIWKVISHAPRVRTLLLVRVT